MLYWALILVSCCNMIFCSWLHITALFYQISYVGCFNPSTFQFFVNQFDLNGSIILCLAAWFLSWCVFLISHCLITIKLGALFASCTCVMNTRSLCITGFHLCYVRFFYIFRGAMRWCWLVVAISFKLNFDSCILNF